MNTNPKFTPNWGALPPVLAGRENEKTKIKLALDDLERGRSPAANFALIGPRGNGKTALLRWVEKEAENCNGRIDCVELGISCFESESVLVEALADDNLFAALAGDGFEATINMFRSGYAISRQAAAKKLLRPVLRKRCTSNGLAILIDEGHMLYKHPDEACAFFSDVQALSGKGLPLLLILAGTPGMSARLTEIEATFWDGLKKFGIGLLDAEAVPDALRTPLKRMGYGIEDNVLEAAADAVQCYPFFLQVIGNALEEIAKAEPHLLGAGNKIGATILERALNELLDRRKNLYAERYRELRKQRVLTAAEAVAECFASQKNNSIASAEVEWIIRQSYAENAKDAVAASEDEIESAAWEIEAKLSEVGFIWSQIGQEEFCEPGIPSLMDYIVSRTRMREQVQRQKLNELEK